MAVKTTKTAPVAKSVAKEPAKEAAKVKAVKTPAKETTVQSKAPKALAKDTSNVVAAKTTDDVKTPATKGVTGKYRIDCVYGDLYQFYLYANNGQLLYESREYSSKKSCTDGIETFKRNMEDPLTTVRVDQDKNKRFKYIIKNRNSIYVGETYANKGQAESSAESVKRFASISALVD
ncbi:MAG: YegP family protein [Clostridia bacterium]